MTPGDVAAGGAAERLHEHVERHRDGSLRARGAMFGDEPHGAYE
jgi:hypothetical protein